MYEELEKLMIENRDVLIRLKEGEPKEVWNYLFEFNDEEDKLCGERIFIQCDTLPEAEEVLKISGWYGKVAFLGIYDDDEAEILGYDTY